MNLMPYDELNTFKAMVTEYKTAPLTNDEQARLRLDIEDYIEFLLIEAYVYGNVQAMQDLGIIPILLPISARSSTFPKNISRSSVIVVGSVTL